MLPKFTKEVHAKADGYRTLPYLPRIPSKTDLNTSGGDEFPDTLRPALRTGGLADLHLLNGQDLVKSMFTFIAFEFVEGHCRFAPVSGFGFRVSGFE